MMIFQIVFVQQEGTTLEVHCYDMKDRSQGQGPWSKRAGTRQARQASLASLALPNLTWLLGRKG